MEISSNHSLVPYFQHQIISKAEPYIASSQGDSRSAFKEKYFFENPHPYRLGMDNSSIYNNKCYLGSSKIKPLGSVIDIYA